jgi:hypothetical protein
MPEDISNAREKANTKEEKIKQEQMLKKQFGGRF